MKLGCSSKKWALLSLLFMLFKSTLQLCEIQQKKMLIFGRERIFYSFIICTDIYAPDELRNDILNLLTSPVQYLEITDSSIPEINQKLFESMNLTEVRIRESNVQIIQEKAFEGANLSSINLENNHINVLKVNCFSSSLIYVLNLKNNSLKSVNQNDFVGLINLRKLNFKSNQIKTIHKDAFKDLNALEELDLSYNDLSSFDVTVFRPLKQLQIIYLNDNQLYMLNPYVFTENKILQYVNIENNYLSTVDATVYPLSVLFINATNNRLVNFNFSNLVNLDTVDLSYNKLSTTRNCLKNLISLKFLHLNDNYLAFGAYLNESFSHLRNLTVVELDGNRFRRFDFSIFQNNKNIEGISVVGNRIGNIDFGNFTSTLKLVNLSSNFIENVWNLSKLTQLSKLDLSKNNISEIPYDMFNGTTTLTALNMNYNSIKKINLGCFRDLQSLTELHLSHNQISSVENGIFNGLSGLTRLEIAYNNLSEFDEDVFHNTKRLSMLDISFNNMSNANVRRIISHMPWIREINLNGNNWTCTALVNIVRDNKIIQLSRGESHNVSNVFGVPCSNENNGKYYDKSQYVVDMAKVMNITMVSSRDISLKMNINNIMLILILLVICGKVFFDRFNVSLAAAKQFVYKKAQSEQELQLII